MILRKAIDALKRKDFAAAQGLLSREGWASYTFQHYLARGLAEEALGEWAAALETFLKATEKFPEQALLWMNRGIAEENLKLYDAAIESHERCLSLAPMQAEACGNLSNLYRRKNRPAEAEAMARKALSLGAAKGDSLNSLGLALAKQGKFDEARRAFEEAYEAAPDHADILFNQANLEVEVFDSEKAFRLFAAARAIDDKPVYRRDEGLARLLAGDYAQGFALFDARLAAVDALRLLPACPRWQGENLKGKKLLIIAEQGFGDVIHFCRYQAFIPEGDLVWAVPKSLVRLLAPSLRGEVLDEKGPLPACAYYAPIMSLALLHPMPIEMSAAYLAAPAAPRLPRGAHQRKIGLVWAGSHTHLRDAERSVPLKILEPLLKSVEADFYAPFIGDALNEIGDMPIARLDGMIGDFADTAALIKQMDCLVTVDTAAAHVAGALGVKTFLMLPLCPDWRWGTAGETTPLYPSVSLIRQERFGDWEGAVKEIGKRL